MNENRLAFEKSPYLLQHRKNPVDWFPWGEEAFSLAQAMDRPLFLSIGYSTCHWCHVMAHESFENPDIARLLNEFFVSVKVDREERPDVDRVYMAFVQATTGSGGWPLSVWLTPRGEPFFGGTYYPPEDRYGRPGFPHILQTIHQMWQDGRDQINRHGRAVFTELAKGRPPCKSSVSVDAACSITLKQFEMAFDSQHGGFGEGPKFPRPAVFEFLLRCPENSERARYMCLFSLQKIALGGICDHLGGGFHRYAVDEFWHVPHFEKMLYDQAQLAVAFTEAFQVSGDPLFAQAALHTLDYVSRDLSHPDGGFYSAEDADSEVPDGSGRHAEGAFYVWKISEVREVLGSELGELFCKAYQVFQSGNVPKSGDPHGEFQGLNILMRRQEPRDFTKEVGLSEGGVEESLATARYQLFSKRSTRPRPHLDDKILAAWNGLAISGFARAGIVFGRDDLVARARKAAEFLRTHLWIDGKLIRVWREGISSIAGFTADYASIIQGLLDLYEADLNCQWVEWALELQSVLDCKFWDEQEGCYFESIGSDRLPRSMKDTYDGAEPAANSLCALNLFRLSRMFHNSDFEHRSKRIVSAFFENISALPLLLSVALCWETPPEEIVIAGPAESPKTRAFLSAIRRKFRPYAILLLADGAQGTELFSRNNPLLREMKPVNGNPAVYICKEFACQAPIVDLDEI